MLVERPKMSQKSAKFKNAHFVRKFVTRQKSMNFGTMVDGHRGHRISTNCEWEISVTFLFFEFFNFDPKYLKKCPPQKKTLRFLAKMTQSRVKR